MRVAIYTRVSTPEQVTDNQEVICREYCQRVGAEVYKVYTDSGVSGLKISRPAFDAMLKDMRMFKFDTVMVTKLDRIGRSLQHVLSLFDEFKNKHVDFISVTQNIDTSSPAGTLMFQIIGAFAEFERNLISERTKEGLIGKTTVGKRGKDRRPRKRRSTR